MASTISVAVTAPVLMSLSPLMWPPTGKQIVLAAHLHAMAGKIEQAHAALLLQRIAESGDRLLHLGLVGVGLQT